jgi:hypothetical protein
MKMILFRNETSTQNNQQLGGSEKNVLPLRLDRLAVQSKTIFS